MYLRGSRAVILVCSADDEKSFNQILEWKKFVESQIEENIPKFLVQNKCDLIGKYVEKYQDEKYLREFAK